MRSVCSRSGVIKRITVQRGGQQLGDPAVSGGRLLYAPPIPSSSVVLQHRATWLETPVGGIALKYGVHQQTTARAGGGLPDGPGSTRLGGSRGEMPGLDLLECVHRSEGTLGICHGPSRFFFTGCCPNRRPLNCCLPIQVRWRPPVSGAQCHGRGRVAGWDGRSW